METPEILTETLALERIEVNTFRGVSPDDGPGRIFGGQVIAQSLLAAYETVEDRICHSLHCYFIRPGDPRIPILFEVDRSRDGGSFTTRRVIAVQNGKQIFNLAASFQVAEDGFEHQAPMPAVRSAGDMAQEAEAHKKAVLDGMSEEMRRMMNRPRPIEMVGRDNYGFGRKPKPSEPKSDTWMRAVAPIGDDARMHQVILAYASDMNLLSTAMRPHGVVWQTPGLQSASLDHAMWFHRPVHVDRWLLYDMISPSASSARGFAMGRLFQDGAAVASCAQEGLIRVLD